MKSGLLLLAGLGVVFGTHENPIGAPNGEYLPQNQYQQNNFTIPPPNQADTRGFGQPQHQPQQFQAPVQQQQQYQQPPQQQYQQQQQQTPPFLSQMFNGGQIDTNRQVQGQGNYMPINSQQQQTGTHLASNIYSDIISGLGFGTIGGFGMMGGQQQQQGPTEAQLMELRRLEQQRILAEQERLRLIEQQKLLEEQRLLEQQRLELDQRLELELEQATEPPQTVVIVQDVGPRYQNQVPEGFIPIMVVDQQDIVGNYHVAPQRDPSLENVIYIQEPSTQHRLGRTVSFPIQNPNGGYKYITGQIVEGW